MNELTEEEWQAWYGLTPQERWRESTKLWEFYLAMGGSLDPESESQSPFDAYYPPRRFLRYDKGIERTIPSTL